MSDIDKALDLIGRYGCIDGAHHKDWVLDQVARALHGGVEIDGRYTATEKYRLWVACLKAGEDGPETYGYDEGIAP